MMDTLDLFLRSQTLLLTLTLATYLGAAWLYRRTGWVVLHPILVSVSVLIAFLYVAQIPYEVYFEQVKVIDFLLSLSVVALGYVLHSELERIRENWVTILASISVGSVVGIVSVVLIARWMGANELVVASLGPKSITTPIAITLAQNAGGVPALTSVVVILVGIFGGAIGPFLFRKLGIESRLARGLALGSAAHALGTVKALELGAVEGALSGLAIGVMGAITALLFPLIMQVL